MEERESQQDVKIGKLETSFDFMTEKLINIEKMVIAFDEKLNQALDKKADKWTENGVKFIYGTLGLSLFVALITWIIKIDLK